MRGRRAQAHHGRVRDRSTPARAGPTCSPTTGSPPPREHPRACGADLGRVARLREAGGAPPRVRGRPQRPLRRRHPPGSTPARAGPTTHRPPQSPPPREHPRACGADKAGPRVTGRTKGAPPRVRGRLRPAGRADVRVGSTPARAGPTGRQSTLPPWTGEHPRACGADTLPIERPRRPPGAPPRVRGRRAGRRPRRTPGGSTPARAGPTPTCSTSARRVGEHPRACGADSIVTLTASGGTGAPPRVRGRQAGVAGVGDADRSTPARAGPTGCPAPAPARPGEHPRACGADSG